MASVSDILMLQVGLDTADFKSQGQGASEQIDRISANLKQKTGLLEKGVKDILGSIDNAVRKITDIFISILTFDGFRQLISQTVEAGTSLQLFAQSIGETVGAASEMRQAFESLFPGGASKIDKAAATIVQGQTAIKMRTIAPGQYPQWANLLGQSPFGFSQSYLENTPPYELILAVIKKARESHKSPTDLAQYLGPLGFTAPDVAGLLDPEKSPEQALGKIRKAGTAETEVQAASAIRLRASMLDTENSASRAMRELVVATEPFLTGMGKFVKDMLDWAFDILRWLENDPAIKLLGYSVFYNPLLDAICSSRVTLGDVLGSGDTHRNRGGGYGGGGGGYGGGGGGGSGSRGLNVDQRKIAGTVVSGWKEAGMSEAGIAGVLANIQNESSFDPNSREADQPHFSGEAHYAHGLYQEGGDEWNNYEKWLNKNHSGADWRDPTLQTEFAAWNLRTNYPKVWKEMLEAKTPGEAAAAYVRGYLKPASGPMAERTARYLRGIPGIEFYLKEQSSVDTEHLSASIASVRADAEDALKKQGVDLRVTSGYRSPQHNADVGGASGSQHMSGNAIDVGLAGLTEDQKKAVVNQLLRDPRVHGFGYYPSGDSIHVDVRSGDRAAWGADYHGTSVGSGWPSWLTDTVHKWQENRLPKLPDVDTGAGASAKQTHSEINIDETSHETVIHSVEVHTGASDAKAIADDVHKEITKKFSDLGAPLPLGRPETMSPKELVKQMSTHHPDT